MWSRERAGDHHVAARPGRRGSRPSPPPSRDLHSGMYGGAARNPIHVLAAILAALHDDDGRVTIPGFYDGVAEIAGTRSSASGTSSASTPWSSSAMSACRSRRARAAARCWSRSGRGRPREVNGIFGGYTGTGFKTVIPSQASAPRSRSASSATRIRRRSREAFAHSCARACRPTARSSSFPTAAARRIRLPIDGPWLPARAQRAGRRVGTAIRH